MTSKNQYLWPFTTSTSISDNTGSSAQANSVNNVYANQANPIAVAPSILSADFGRLHEEIQDVQNAGAEWIHVDVMDGHFVPNITIGPAVVKAVAASTDCVVDVHLMISHPDAYLEDFAQAGADVITVHVEACTHLHRTLQRIRQLGKKVGVSLNPHTCETELAYILEQVDLVLVMTVNPGFGGQTLIAQVVPKIRAIREMIEKRGLTTVIEVDGGVTAQTVGLVASAGARVIVAGSAVFGKTDRQKAIDEIRLGAMRAMLQPEQGN